MSVKRKIKGSPIRNTLLTWFVAAAVIFVLTSGKGYYPDHSFWVSLVAGLHNTLFDLLIIGVLIYWLNKRVETRIEVQRYKEEIDTWRNDGSLMAKRRNQASIRRLTEYGVYDIDLSRSSLQQLDLTGVVLRECNLSDAQCYRIVLKDADLRNAIIDRADLKGATLTGANLSGASLRNAVLEYAHLQGANLKGSDLTDANVSNVIWKQAQYDDTTKFPYDFDKSEMVCSNGDSGVFGRIKNRW
jgi:hypothetical protein